MARERSGVRSWSGLLDGESVERGVSANLCSAVSSLILIDQGVALSVSGALTHAAPRTTDFRVRFTAQDQEKVAEMASSSRQTTGLVKRGGRVRAELESREGTEKCEGKGFCDGKRRTLVLKNLSRNEYERVLEAHRRGRDVEFLGVLRNEGRSRWLEGVETIRVLECVMMVGEKRSLL